MERRSFRSYYITGGIRRAGREDIKKGRPRAAQHAMRTKVLGCLGSAGSVQMRLAVVDRLRLHPLIGFLLRFVFAASVSRSQPPVQWVFLACSLLEVVDGQLAPLLAGFALHLFPVAFHSVPSHS